MKVLLQRVNFARVLVEEKTVGEIGRGLLLFVGFGQDDDEKKLASMAVKLCNMRVFENEKSHFDKSLLDIGGEVLLVPQFTLFADTSKGRRPEFFKAMEPDRATGFFDQFVDEFRKLHINVVQTGIFGDHMHVELENNGPVTIMVEL
ncbi:MAG: D-tyrosyl-tRNA(Tyr) deacylase [SAR324 cluster bacterium]|uniref:D-aminoacyl-tRNA deacylase n=1 Tax=SAR324 cluster bacterium TaxID=2024889 RepID=A0A7X9FSJ9_9DELT|nr:D-tyrosyl-tRNA(Tyr) deacylase [SAR324 cluster bacterium]